jgi:hypothetical protein
MWRVSERRRAAATIGTALAVALAGWGAARLIGIELAVDKGGAGTDTVQVIDAALATVLAGLAAWAASTLMVRRGAGRGWPFVGSTALAVSMVGPSYQADGAAAMALMTLHLMVGAVLIAGFTRPAPNRCADITPPRDRTTEPIPSSTGARDRTGAIDHDVGAGDVGGFVAGQEVHGADA